ncbi:MAG: hypothetical protein LC663_03730, partial [Actinobacteria bacterium]|nr:hypothetical protein [Actinomycetota bacterium]
LATGNAYTDDTLTECSRARGRQNEPYLAADPRDPSVIVGSSNDYCGVYHGFPSSLAASGPIWLGYYRSTDGGGRFDSSLVPGYPDDTSPYGQLSDLRTDSAGDPVAAWDSHGRLYMGSESSSSGTKTFGDQWVARFDNPDGAGATDFSKDGLRYLGTTVVAKGSSAPNLLGKFNDKTALNADRTGTCNDAVYFAWSRFSGNGDVSIYFVRSLDQGVTWSNAANLTPNEHDVQDPSINITGNGHVYVTYHTYESNRGHQVNQIRYAKSANCGATFGKSQQLVAYRGWSASDVADPQPIPAQSARDDSAGESVSRSSGSLARDCGDFDAHCNAGFTFPRTEETVITASDQTDTQHEYVYAAFDGSKPGTIVDSTTSYFNADEPGKVAQDGVWFSRLNGATGARTAPALIDDQAVGHQVRATIGVDAGTLHVLWWDTRNDPSYSVQLPPGNDADGSVHPAVDVYAAKSTDFGSSWTDITKITDVMSNPNYEQFSNRTVPFAGDYLGITSHGDWAFGAWTDWRNTVGGLDPREGATDSDADGADVVQCRTYSSSSASWSGDQCPHDGGLDQDIYGDTLP